jgi:hypothetical protein
MNREIAVIPNCCKPVIGQFPGESLTARVVDERGQAARVLLIYLDKDSNQVTSPLYIDETANGYFHYTWPDAPDKLFPAFYSYDPATFKATEFYIPQVLTFQELYDKGIVTMKTAKGSSSTNNVLLGAGLIAGAYILSSKPRKKIGAIAINKKTPRDLVNKFNAKPIADKALTAGVIIGGAWLAWQIFFKYKPTPQQKAILADAQNKLDYLHFQRGIDVTHSLGEFSAYAGSLRNASTDCGTNEAAIFNVISNLNNEADVYQLISSAGILAYKSCAAIEGNWFGDVHNTVPELITSELTGSEIETVNNILQSKGIEYRF